MIRRTINIDRIHIVLGVVLLFVLIGITYLLVISEFYAYAGFDNNLNAFRMVFFIGIFMACCVVHLFSNQDGISYTYSTCVLVFLLIPASIFGIFNDTTILIFVSHVIYFLSIVFISGTLHIGISTPQIKERYRRNILTFISIAMLIPFVIVFGPQINLKNLLLIDIYKARALQSELNNTYLAYTYSWLSKIILPILFVDALIYKKKYLLIYALSALIFMFLCGGHKGVLFGTLMMLIFYKGSYLAKVKRLIFTLLFFSTFALIFFFLFDDFYLISLVTRRVFFVPALIDSFYFDFFRDNHMYWSGSVLSWLFEYPYDTTIPHLIGLEYFGRHMSANNGLVSDGYAQFGMIGIIINFLVVCFLLTLLKGASFRSEYYGLVFIMFFTFTSSALMASLITHGVLLFLFIAMFILKRKSIAS